MDKVAQRVAGLKEAGALHGNRGLAAPQEQAAGNGDGFPLATDTDEFEARFGKQGGLPSSQFAIGQPGDVGDAAFSECNGDGGTVQHGGSRNKRRLGSRFRRFGPAEAATPTLWSSQL